MAFLLALRRLASPDTLVFVDVTLAEHWAAEVFQTVQPRTYFNPTNNQSMGWSIPAALGAQRVHPGRLTVTVTGDGCLLMSAMELSTAAREGLPVKFFVLDDQAYGFMQALQKPAYHRTTATVLARLDYAALAKAVGIHYQEIGASTELEPAIGCALQTPGPVLTRVVIHYGGRPIRWIEAVKGRFKKELTTEQKVRFATRLGVRALEFQMQND
jgi:acetolactate synthase-1/2/3 large subunit